MAPLPELITTRDVAERLNVSQDAVRRWVREGQLSAIVLPSRQLRFRREDVEALLTQTPVSA